MDCKNFVGAKFFEIILRNLPGNFTNNQLHTKLMVENRTMSMNMPPPHTYQVGRIAKTDRQSISVTNLVSKNLPMRNCYWKS